MDIDSIPPATTSSWSPARIIWSAIAIARTLEAQTLLIVSDGTWTGMPAATAAWRAGAWPGAALQHLAHHDVPHLARLDAGALQRGPDGDAPEVGRRPVGQPAAQAAERRAHRRDDHRARHADIVRGARGAAGSSASSAAARMAKPSGPSPAPKASPSRKTIATPK